MKRPNSKPANPPSKTNKIRALLADDSPVMLRALTGFLTGDHRFQVVGTASDGRPALLTAASLNPQLVLVDLHLPHLDGAEVTSGGVVPRFDGTLAMPGMGYGLRYEHGIFRHVAVDWLVLCGLVCLYLPLACWSEARFRRRYRRISSPQLAQAQQRNDLQLAACWT